MAVIAAPCFEPRVNQPRDAATAPAERLGRALEMAMKEARVAVLEPVLGAVLEAVLGAVLEAVEEEEEAAAHRAAARA
jgi:dihydroxyacetone kinase-like predicted kinase